MTKAVNVNPKRVQYLTQSLWRFRKGYELRDKRNNPHTGLRFSVAMNRSVDVNPISSDITLIQHHCFSPTKAMEREEVNLFLVPTEVSDLELFPGQEFLASNDWCGDSIIGGR